MSVFQTLKLYINKLHHLPVLVLHGQACYYEHYVTRALMYLTACGIWSSVALASLKLRTMLRCIMPLPQRTYLGMHVCMRTHNCFIHYPIILCDCLSLSLQLLQYMYDVPMILAHMWRRLFTLEGLVILHKLHILVILLLLFLYLLSPLDIVPEAMLGVLGLLDDFVILLGVLCYVVILYRHHITHDYV